MFVDRTIFRIPSFGFLKNVTDEKDSYVIDRTFTSKADGPVLMPILELRTRKNACNMRV